MDNLIKLQEQVKNEEGKIHPIQADVSKEEDILKAFEYAEKHLGSVHVIINNAGIALLKSVFEGSVEEWKHITDTNFISNCITAREFYKMVTKNRHNGHIINISSITATIYAPAVSMVNLYAPTKAAMNTLANVLRSDLIKQNINVKVTVILV